MTTIPAVLRAEVEQALASAPSALVRLSNTERTDAELLLDLWRSYLAHGSSVVPEDNLKQTRRHTARLVEVLARRSAGALPFAALGRALLAATTGYHDHARELVNEFCAKLARLG